MARAGTRRTVGLVLLAVLAGCGPPARVVLPHGPGQPSDDAAAWLTEATARCAGVRSLTAELSLSGRVDGRRVRARVLAGTDVGGRVRLEALAPFGAPVFVLAADGRDATLLLPREGRVVQGTSVEALLDALAGLRLGGADLHAVLTGCGVAAREAVVGRAYGDRWRAVGLSGGTTLWVERPGAAARLAVAALAGLRVEYGPREARQGAVRLVAGAGDRPRVDLVLGLSQVEENAPLGPEAFAVTLPEGAVPMSIEELRGRGLMAGEVR